MTTQGQRGNAVNRHRSWRPSAILNPFCLFFVASNFCAASSLSKEWICKCPRINLRWPPLKYGRLCKSRRHTTIQNSRWFTRRGDQWKEGGTLSSNPLKRSLEFNLIQFEWNQSCETKASKAFKFRKNVCSGVPTSGFWSQKTTGSQTFPVASFTCWVTPKNAPRLWVAKENPWRSYA